MKQDNEGIYFIISFLRILMRQMYRYYVIGYVYLRYSNSFQPRFWYKYSEGSGNKMLIVHP
mgnify:CR=1 FL=1